MQIKSTGSYHSKSIRIAKTAKTEGMEVEQLKLAYIAGGKAKQYSYFGKQFGNFLQSEVYILYTNVYSGFIFNS